MIRCTDPSVATARPPRRPRAAGFTLIELVLSVATMAIVFGAVGLFQSRSQDQTRVGLARERAEAHARRTLDRVADQLRGVGLTLLTPDPTSALGTSTLTYQSPSGVTGGVVTWSTPSRLQLELEPGESNDGADEDGDGLVDERRLVLVRDVGTLAEMAVVLCTGITELADGETANGADDNGDGLVDEAGFALRRIGDLLTVQISVAVPTGDGGQAVSRIGTSIALRN